MKQGLVIHLLKHCLRLVALLSSVALLVAEAPVHPRPLRGIASSPFGAILTEQATNERFLRAAKEANLAWLRVDAPLWAVVEPAEPTRSPDGTWRHSYDMSHFVAFEARMKQVIRHGLTPVVLLQGTPRWAARPDDLQGIRAENTGPRCLPIRNDSQKNHVQHFAAFVQLVVKRYGGTWDGFAYNIHYWEIWNEPDAAKQSLAAAVDYLGFGCWGDRGDPSYYGGGPFGRMLRAVYPAIKTVDPEATVLHGGLMLTGDDTDPSGGGNSPEGTGRFLKGVLHALYPDGAYDAAVDQLAFDQVPFHSYAYWRNPDEPFFNGHIWDWDLHTFDATAGTWSLNPLSMPEKIRYIRAQLDAYQLGDLPVVLNEGGFQCPQVYLDRRIYCGQPGSPEYAAYLDDQANYVVRYYVRGLANRLGGVAYYTLNGPNFREGGLSTGMDLRPGYTALQFLAGKLSMALPSTACASQLSQGWLEGYRFTDGAKEYRVYWTNDNQRRAEVRRPTGSIAVYDKLGRTLDMPAASDSIGVGFDPIIVESVPQSAWRCDH